MTEHSRAASERRSHPRRAFPRTVPGGDSPSLLQTLLRLDRLTLGAEACLLYLAAPDGRSLVLLSADGVPHPVESHRLPFSRGALGWAARQGQPLLARQRRMPREIGSLPRQLAGVAVESLLAVPVYLEGEVKGLLVAVNRQPEPLAEADVPTLTTFATQIAEALSPLRGGLWLRSANEQIRAEEDLRREVARGLHDGPLQNLAALEMNLEFIRKLMIVQPDRAQQEIEMLRQVIRATARQIRRLVFELRPLALENEGLVAALRSYLDQFDEDARPRMHMQVDGSARRLPAEVERTIFHVVREALHNVRKHASACHAWVILRFASERIEADVIDDGVGFDPDSVARRQLRRTHLGLLTMRERADKLGAHLSVESAPGRGTRIRLVCALKPT